MTTSTHLLRLLALVAVPALGLGACANPTVDACQRWQDSMLALDCVPDDYDVGIVCEDFNDYPCDASPYFDCLENGYTCDADGNFQYDTTECATLASC
jgi:hypothetical protein